MSWATYGHLDPSEGTWPSWLHRSARVFHWKIFNDVHAGTVGHNICLLLCVRDSHIGHHALVTTAVASHNIYLSMLTCGVVDAVDQLQAFRFLRCLRMAVKHIASFTSRGNCSPSNVLVT